MQQPEVIRANVYVNGVQLGGMTPDAAARKLRQWWEVERLRTVTLNSPVVKDLPALTPGKLGIKFDDAATVAALPKGNPTVGFVSQIGQPEPERLDVAPKFAVIGRVAPELIAAIDKVNENLSEAKVEFVAGQIKLTPEKTPVALSEEAFQQNLSNILSNPKDWSLPLPLTEGKKRIPDEELGKIREVVSSFSTTFSAGNRPRSSNIRLAAQYFDGKILLPGQRISYNDTVGQRTRARGFKEAGVYVNGRHDTGIGGGICQVSTTLYNAALFANMKIVQRQCHSLPVPYVPVGRDATVNWGSIDLVLENNLGQPIAIDSEYTPGRLTFRILGTKVPGQMVKITGTGVRYRDRGVRRVVDPSIPAGVTRVIEGGSAARATSTFRTVYVNGQVVKREPLGVSSYYGSPRIIAVGSRRAAPKPAPVAPPDGTGL
ncbi:MAG: VanW family protein [Fimbriimonadaceae bacterium]|nr:VanW family protein [Fimbriimonadaceae bacterium]